MSDCTSMRTLSTVSWGWEDASLIRVVKKFLHLRMFSCVWLTGRVGVLGIVDVVMAPWRATPSVGIICCRYYIIVVSTLIGDYSVHEFAQTKKWEFQFNLQQKESNFDFRLIRKLATPRDSLFGQRQLTIISWPWLFLTTTAPGGSWKEELAPLAMPVCKTNGKGT